ncbi:MAG: hypothetical protein LUD78_06050 [Clostridiales bacterium]|nr:hypothetical protein [Clostridiales bacterium]
MEKLISVFKKLQKVNTVVLGAALLAMVAVGFCRLSVGLLMAGVIPGIMCCVFLCIYAYFKAKKMPKARVSHFLRF